MTSHLLSRLRRTIPADAAALADALPGRQHILITGATAVDRHAGWSRR